MRDESTKEAINESFHWPARLVQNDTQNVNNSHGKPCNLFQKKNKYCR